MSDREPTRLLAGDGPGRALAASMTGDRLAPEARDRMRAALGLAVGAGVATATTKAAAATTTTAAKAALATKLVAALAVVGAVGGAGALAVHESAEPSRPLVTAPPRVSSAARAIATTLPPETALSAQQLPDAPPRRVAPKASSSSNAGDLALEVQLLERARHTLRSGDPAGALRDIDDYRAARPRGALGVEADALEIEALVAQGRSAEAQSKGRTFLRRHPEGPLSERVRRLVGG